MISHSVVHAALARQPDAELALAGYNAAHSMHQMIGGLVWSATMTSLAFVDTRNGTRRLVYFYQWVAWGISLSLLFFVTSPIGDWFFRELVGMSAAAALEARIAAAWMAFIFPAVVFRSAAYGVLMQARRTPWITAGTLVRLLGLFVLLSWLPRVFSGAAVGGAAIFGCIFIECVFALGAAWFYYRRLPRGEEHSPSYMSIFLFAWPLMLANMSEFGLPFFANFFLGRMARPDRAIASFGILDGLFRLLLHPLRNLTQTAQALVRSAAERRQMLRFTLQTSLIFFSLVLLILPPPVRNGLLEGIIGLSPELAAEVAPGLYWGLPLALCLGWASALRGMLLQLHITRPIATMGLLRLSVGIAVCAFALRFPSINGAVLGAVALVCAFGAEALAASLVFSLRVRNAA